MPLKVQLAQLKSDPNAFEANFQSISQEITAAIDQKADLLVFPELMICGYAHLDLVNHQDFLDFNQEYLNKIISQVPETLYVILGFVEQIKDKKFNAAAVINNQQVITVIQKQLLPTYDIFAEERYFKPGIASKLIQIKDTKVGIGICEDLWDKHYDQKVYPQLIAQGAELLINISASPYRVGKLEERINLVESLLAKHPAIDFVYVNLVGGYDGYEGEIVFDGQSFVRSSKGKYYPLACCGAEESMFVDLSVPASLTANDLLNQIEETCEIYQLLIMAIKDYFRRTKLTKAYIGLSGGIDSAVCYALLVEALGKNQVVAVNLPSHITSDETKEDASRMASELGTKYISYSIKQLFKSWLQEAEDTFTEEPSDMTRQNLQARLRGLVLMSLANQDQRAVVVTTGNKTEIALGYCTIYGDMCGALAPIADLNKARVYNLARYINNKFQKEIIPQTIIDRPPTAELAPDQTDEENLPADYQTIAPLVDEIIESKYSYHELINNYDQKVVDETLHLIKINEFKRRQAAPGIRLTSKAFGMGRRVPMVY